MIESQCLKIQDKQYFSESVLRTKIYFLRNQLIFSSAKIYRNLEVSFFLAVPKYTCEDLALANIGKSNLNIFTIFF